MGLKETIEENEDVRSMDDYAKNFKHGDITEKEAQLVLQYAKDKYSRLVNDVEYLDNKADRLIKYLGIVPPGLAAISGYLASFQQSASIQSRLFASCGWLVPAGIIGGIATWVAAISFALWVLSPADNPCSVSIQNLFEEAKDRKEGKILEAALALRYGKTISRLIRLADHKGERLKLGYILTAGSIFLLLLSFVAGRI